MKTTIVLSILLLLSGCATFTPITYSDYSSSKEIVIDVDKNEAFVIANSWMVETFNDAESVIQFSDKEAGIIKGKYLMRGTLRTVTGLYGTTSTSDSRVYAIITIQVKEGLTKISINPQGEGTYYIADENSAMYQSVGLSPDGMNEVIDGLMNEYEDYIKSYNKW